MAKERMNITIDPELKKEAKKLLDEFGLSFSMAITIFLRTAVKEQRIPFDIRVDVHNEETIKAIMEYEEMKNNPEKYKRHSSFDEILEELDEKESDLDK